MITLASSAILFLNRFCFAFGGLQRFVSISFGSRELFICCGPVRSIQTCHWCLHSLNVVAVIIGRTGPCGIWGFPLSYIWSYEVFIWKDSVIEGHKPVVLDPLFCCMQCRIFRLHQTEIFFPPSSTIQVSAALL